MSAAGTQQSLRRKGSISRRCLSVAFLHTYLHLFHRYRLNTVAPQLLESLIVSKACLICLHFQIQHSKTSPSCLGDDHIHASIKFNV